MRAMLAVLPGWPEIWTNLLLLRRMRLIQLAENACILAQLAVCVALSLPIQTIISAFGKRYGYLASSSSRGDVMNVKNAIFMLLGVMLIGCGQSNTPAGHDATTSRLMVESAADRKSVEEMKAELDSLTSQLKTAQDAVVVLQANAAVDSVLRDGDRVAELRVGSEDYQLVRSDLGVLTVALVDVQPYANGSRVVLKFGNPLASTINGLKVNLGWGPNGENARPDDESARSKDITFSQSIQSGAWTSVPVVLEGVPPASLDYIRVSHVTHTGIALRRQ